MSKKTVWYISKHANILKYGAETRQASFCKQFADKNCDVTLISSNSSHLFSTLPKFKGRYFEEKNDNYNVLWVNTPQYKQATSVKRILTWFWFEFFLLLLPFRQSFKKPDVVIASSLSLLSVFSGCFYKFFYKSTFIFEVRDIWPQTLIDLKGMSKNHPFILFLALVEKLGYKYADKVVGTMPGLAKHVETIIGTTNKVKFIPQGVSLDFYQNSQQPASKDYIKKYFPENKFIVTYAGTLGKAYALEYIISSAKLLAGQQSNVHFVFLGNGIEEHSLKKQAKGLSNVTFAPRVKKDQVLGLLMKSDLLLHSFKMEKVFEFGISPNKFIDYMYAKKPIVCMFSGFPSMIDEANCGEFIPSENSPALVETLLKYAKMPKDKLNELGENGYRFLVEKRNFDVLSDQYMELFSD